MSDEKARDPAEGPEAMARRFVVMVDPWQQNLTNYARELAVVAIADILRPLFEERDELRGKFFDCLDTIRDMLVAAGLPADIDEMEKRVNGKDKPSDVVRRRIADLEARLARAGELLRHLRQFKEACLTQTYLDAIDRYLSESQPAEHAPAEGSEHEEEKGDD